MTTVRELHVLLAFISVSGFALRGALSLLEARMLERRWIRVSPHVVDTLLLAFGVTLAVRFRISPLEHGWLAAKLLMLIGYVGFGVIAMRARRRGVKALGYVCALLAASYIIAVAYARAAIPVWP